MLADPQKGRHQKKQMKAAIISSLFFCALSFFGCNNDKTKIYDQEIQVTIKSAETYKYDLMISGDEEGASIKTPPEHAQWSQLVRDQSTNWSVVYVYQPFPDYTGQDYVEIETCTGGEPTGCTNIQVQRINFTIE